MNIPNFDVRKFNGLASVCIVFIIGASIFSLVLSWSYAPIYAKISGIASTAFYFLLLWLFYDGWRKAPQTKNMLNEEELQQLVEQYK